MSCQIILMDVDGNHAFEVDEVIDVIATGIHPGTAVLSNPIFKVIQSDMDIEEAAVLMTPEYDIFMNLVKQRDKILYTRDILAKEIEMQKAEVITRIVLKEPESFEQMEDVIVG